MITDWIESLQLEYQELINKCGKSGCDENFLSEMSRDILSFSSIVICFLEISSLSARFAGNWDFIQIGMTSSIYMLHPSSKRRSFLLGDWANRPIRVSPHQLSLFAARGCLKRFALEGVTFSEG